MLKNTSCHDNNMTCTPATYCGWLNIHALVSVVENTGCEADYEIGDCDSLETFFYSILPDSVRI